MSRRGTSRIDTPDPLSRVRAAAAARNLRIELRERPEAGSLGEAASLLGLRPADIVKTLVVKRLALHPAGRRVTVQSDNPAYPVTWRVDNELGISPSRCIAESWTIGTGETDRYRYRMHVFRGAIDHDRLERRWQRFAGTPS